MAKKIVEQEVASLKPVEIKDQTPVSFDVWFMGKVGAKGRVKANHYHMILAFFKNHNLSEKEPAYKYDAALKIFGY